MVLMKRTTSVSSNGSTSNLDEAEKAKRILPYGDGVGSSKNYLFPPVLNDDDIVNNRANNGTNASKPNGSISKPNGTTVSKPNRTNPYSSVTKRSKCGGLTVLLLKGIVIIGTIVFAISTYMELDSRRKQLSRLNRDFQKLEIASAEVEDELLSALSQFKRLEDNMMFENNVNPNRDEITNGVIKRQEVMVNRVVNIQREVQRLHYHQIANK